MTALAESVANCGYTVGSDLPVHEATETGVAGTTKLTLPEMEKSGRLKYILFSQDFFLLMLQQRRGGLYFKVDEPGLPDDAVIVGWSDHYRFAYNQIAVKVWSSTFPVIAEGALLPELALMVRQIKVAEPAPTAPVSADEVVRETIGCVSRVKMQRLIGTVGSHPLLLGGEWLLERADPRVVTPSGTCQWQLTFQRWRNGRGERRRGDFKVLLG